ncbi:BolA family transcriptional regulator [Synechococcus sp. Nb3U1]|uniref:BolA family protein n=1 Tax=Synechococcus sp. Nb3U1 TaxID=1914529 RepID=UPI001F1D2B29|nr:BolA family protein [Synechococcus sp. Nb3U1]MCF2970593.1 BolA family transcriptional regulator [Synechococcus sp. Nb3U1]
MITPEQLRLCLVDRLQALHVQVEDESHRHAGHGGRRDPLGAGGHYRVQIVSPLFAGKTTLQQHRLVYGALAEQMGINIHALALQTYSPEQWTGSTPGSASIELEI